MAHTQDKKLGQLEVLWPRGGGRKGGSEVEVTQNLLSPLQEGVLCEIRFKRDIVDTFFHASRAACLTRANKWSSHLHGKTAQ